MRLIYKDWRYNAECECSVGGYIKSTLGQTDYYQTGVAENADTKAENCAGAIGRLVEILVEKGLLDAKDVNYIAGGLDQVVRIIED
jgi:hypothetical protein